MEVSEGRFLLGGRNTDMGQVLGQVLEQAAKTGRMLEADETGMLTIPAELLGYPEPNARFVVEQVGGRIFIQPEPAEDEWLKQWRELAEEIGKVWPEGVSAVDVVSEMRR